MKSSNEHMELVRLYLDGEASREEVDQLEALMLGDPQLRSDFLAYARVDSALPRVIGEKGDIVTFNDPATPSRNWMSWMSAAAVFIMTLLLSAQFLYRNETSLNTKVVAQFGEMSNCRWVDSTSRLISGDSIRSGQRIELSSGIAHVVFNTGAKLEIVGPTIIEIQSEKSSFLTMGEVHLVAETPESKGFVLETPISKFVDIGTAFTAMVSPDGLSRLDVIQGEVDVHVEKGDPARRLKAGEALYVEPGHNNILTRIEKGDETAEFLFPNIAPPSNSDYADVSSGNATIHVVQGVLKHEGSAHLLLNGAGQSKQDSPMESTFFNSSGEKGLMVDLGALISINKINTYSWHQNNLLDEHRERALQQYTLYGFSGDEVPVVSTSVDDSPVRSRLLVKAGWKRIARVNSDQLFQVNERLDRPAQQACSIKALQGDIGKYRYLLWVVKRNTFFGEFDVFGSP